MATTSAKKADRRRRLAVVEGRHLEAPKHVKSDAEAERAQLLADLETRDWDAFLVERAHREWLESGVGQRLAVAYALCPEPEPVLRGAPTCSPDPAARGLSLVMSLSRENRAQGLRDLGAVVSAVDRWFKADPDDMVELTLAADLPDPVAEGLVTVRGGHDVLDEGRYAVDAERVTRFVRGKLRDRVRALRLERKRDGFRSRGRGGRYSVVAQGEAEPGESQGDAGDAAARLLVKVDLSLLQERARMTDRERQVWYHLCRGMKRAEVAKALGIRPKTVSELDRRIHKKIEGVIFP